MTYKGVFGYFRLIVGVALLGSVVWQITDRVVNNLFRPWDYFTKLSIDSSIFAGIVLVISAFMLLRGKSESARMNVIRLGATVAMIVIGVGYHALLGDAALDPLDAGYEWPRPPNNMIHTYAPILITIDYLLSVKGPKTNFIKGLWVLVFPYLWVAFSIIRGLSEDVWPYWFLNPAEVGGLGVLLYTLGFTVFGLGLAFVLILLRRLVQKLTGNLRTIS
ncbi:MAG: Pr6Pr family membrane protein [Aquiluna sp.]|nr:Pr6Pr family membrane protein [Aquiluna sp.]MCF8545638.1 Pr6Pr family membrane protein [Aquiluna sp.]